ncbi:MAG TPA: NYN domain-containing protein [Gemmatimonadales bacterium]|nr:NYN domain-containing protein [Gemmatimonadales bacterium]
MIKPPLRLPRAGDVPVHAPNAALLIDFDNVTLGIRSDLTKELKNLLNSDIIKGKVSVQRAYADWRRYPQYIVPLSESSIDLIFAPAFGTNKKNATDIRLAIDAMELVFTRPEIGTFILLSGDSDFSSMVIKLKEYGKYVIGVGIRESASDLLIQNCDEYYSYSDLAGLTKEAEKPSTQRDPWELVREAVDSMVRNSDVMRSDRLKQVMQQIDPNFDEKNAGYNRFSKFVVEAGNRGLLKITKLDNGQYEVGAGEASPGLPPAPEEPREEGAGSGRGRGRGRGRRGRGGRPERAPEAAQERAQERAQGGLTLAQAFDLMRRALSELPSPTGHEALRHRMASLHGRQDSLLEPARFTRLLRQAHDAEVADVRKVGDNDYEVESRAGVAHPLPVARLTPPPAPTPEASPADQSQAPAATLPLGDGQRLGLGFRRGSRMPAARAEVPLVGVISMTEGGEAAPEGKPAGRRRGGGGRGPRKEAGTAAATDGGTQRRRPRGRTPKKKAE